MSSVWHRRPSGWEPLASDAFEDEAALHALAEEAPQLLPLAGDPGLAIIGREVAIGAGYVDLLGVEPTGRLVVIEIKLARNAEARRKVVAQTLDYAASLRGTPLPALERAIAPWLRTRGFASLDDAVRAQDQAGAFDLDALRQGLADSLASGLFRLTLVLDSVPLELVRLSGYLAAVAEGLDIDLIEMRQFAVGDEKLLIPRRAEFDEADGAQDDESRKEAKAKGQIFDGHEVFEASIDQAPEAARPQLRELLAFARSLEDEGLAYLQSYAGTIERWTLLPRFHDTGTGLVTIWNEKRAYLSCWRSVFEKKAPETLRKMQATRPDVDIGQGKTVTHWDDELLELLRAGYREGAGRG